MIHRFLLPALLVLAGCCPGGVCLGVAEKLPLNTQDYGCAGYDSVPWHDQGVGSGAVLVNASDGTCSAAGASPCAECTQAACCAEAHTCLTADAQAECEALASCVTANCTAACAGSDGGPLDADTGPSTDGGVP